MTTVVCDGVFIACDSRRNVDSSIDAFEHDPKFRVERGRIFTGSGRETWIDALVHWYFNRNEPYPLRDKESDERDSEALVFDGTRWKKYVPDTPFPETCPKQWAAGSGRIPALAAMLCKKNAPQSVAIAMQLDLYSGGRIFVAELSKLVSGGNAAITEFRNGLSIDRKSRRAPKPVLAREIGRDLVGIRKRGKEHQGRSH